MPQSSNEQSTYIHGTTSDALEAMSRTDNQLMPILLMLEQYLVAPMTGELVRGGYDILEDDDFIGAPSFGSMSNEGLYSLQDITRRYTRVASVPNSTHLDNLNKILSTSFDGAFSNFNLLLIYFARVKQTAHTAENIIQPEKLDTLRCQLDATVQFYYFMQLLGKHIFPDLKLLAQAQALSQQPDIGPFKIAVRRHLTFTYIVQKIIDHNINMQEILANPTEENLKKALQVLELPERYVTMADKQRIDLHYTLFFGLSPVKSSENIYSCVEPFGSLSRNAGHDQINEILTKVLAQQRNMAFLIELGTLSKEYIEVLKARINLFERLVAHSGENISTIKQSASFKESFPVVLVSRSDKIEPFGCEFRSKVPLTLGKDIHIIATDNEQHQAELRHYFYTQLQLPMQIILFTELKNYSDLPLSIDTPHLRNLFFNMQLTNSPSQTQPTLCEIESTPLGLN